jgi:hypothetical protein
MVYPANRRERESATYCRDDALRKHLWSKRQEGGVLHQFTPGESILHSSLSMEATKLNTTLAKEHQMVG